MIRVIPTLGALALVGFALGLVFIPGIPQVLATATTSTSTIIGWNIPSGTTFNNGLVAMILPLVTMGVFAGLGLMFTERGGSLIITMSLIGYIVGAAAGMLSFPTTSAPTLIPFANLIIAGTLLLVWIWQEGN